MNYEIRVLPKKEVLDSQGRATQSVLEKAGFEINECKVGRYITIDTDKSKEEILKMADYVLYNPLIEDVEISEIK